jgi:hypothetical protein
MSDSNSDSNVVSTKVNKSDEIRNYLRSAPPEKRMPKDVCEALAEKGIEVSNSFVSIVKSKFYNGNKQISKKNKVGDNQDFGKLLLAKEYIKAFGGDFSAAKKNLELFIKLRD